MATSNAASALMNCSMPSRRCKACSVSFSAVSASLSNRLVAFISRARTCNPGSLRFSFATALSVVLISSRVRVSRPFSLPLLINAWARPRLLSGSLKRDCAPCPTAWR
ncbi:hypothetical protein FQZ97_1026790 [compost metagenome]